MVGVDLSRRNHPEGPDSPTQTDGVTGDVTRLGAVRALAHRSCRMLGFRVRSEPGDHPQVA